jgi:hypothetical protein
MGFEHRAVKHLACRYTNYAIPVPEFIISWLLLEEYNSWNLKAYEGI